MLLSVDIWERSIWSPLKIILIQDNILTLQVWGKKKCVPSSCRENQPLHTHLGLKPQLIWAPCSQTQSILWDERMSQWLCCCSVVTTDSPITSDGPQPVHSYLIKNFLKDRHIELRAGSSLSYLHQGGGNKIFF